MNKELQNTAWANAPAEFRKEVREKYRAAKVLSKNTSDIFSYKCELLKHLFGSRNLTSGTEPEEIISFRRRNIIRDYADKMAEKGRHDITQQRKDQISGWISCLKYLFGSKCLPDTAPEQSEPKYNKGDRMAIKYINKIGVIDEVLGYNEEEDGIYYRLKVEPKGIATAREENITPYTDPTDKAEEKYRCDNLLCCRNGEDYLEKGQCDKVLCARREQKPKYGFHVYWNFTNEDEDKVVSTANIHLDFKTKEDVEYAAQEVKKCLERVNNEINKKNV